MFATSSRLHVNNLTGLMWVRERCRASLDEAALLFALDHHGALFYSTLSDASIDALSCELDISLFVPRFDSITLAAALAKGNQGSDTKGKPDGLELHNLIHMQALRDVCAHGVGEAAWLYRMNRETVDAYRALDDAQAADLCKRLAVCALVPRYDATQAGRLLDKPAGTRALFSAAYESEIAAASTEAALRNAYLTH
jgi:hypothetical protein